MAMFSLHELAGSGHPLMEEGSFSIYNDPIVSHLDGVRVVSTFDLDGVCLVSR